MKRLTALFLSLLFLFNLAGYRLFFHYIQEKADARYQISIDKDSCDNAEFLTLNVDLDMPYLAENTSFERVNGEIEVDGMIYKYVKRKISNGQLVLLCLPDQKKTNIKSARDQYFSIANSLASHTGSKQQAPKASVEKNVTGDYDQHLFSYKIGCSSNTTKFNSPLDEMALSPAFRNLPAQPPESVLV